MDIKTILLVIILVGILGAIIFLGIKVLISIPSTTKEYSVQENTIENANNNTSNNFGMIVTSNTNSNYTNEENEEVFSNDKMSQIYGTGLSINNNKPKTDFPDFMYYSIVFSLPGNSRCTYYVPYNWEREETKMIDPITGATVEGKGSKISEFMNVEYQTTTYEDVLNGFVEKEKNNAVHKDELEFSTRGLVVNGNNYTILMKNDGNIRTSYIVFIKGLYEYHLQFDTTDDKYDDKMIEIIDNIFSSFKVS